MSDAPVRPLPCARCGLDPRDLCDGYAPAADLETILEEVPPAVLSYLARALRDHAAGRLTGGAGISFDGSRGQVHQWHKLGTVQETVEAKRARRAG